MVNPATILLSASEQTNAAPKLPHPDAPEYTA